MSYKPSSKELEALIATPGPKRYKYFVDKVADNSEVWGLKDAEGWFVVGGPDGDVCIPLWPAAEYAAAYDKTATPTPISLSVWLKRWLPGCARDGNNIAVFPVPGKAGVIVKPGRLGEDLESELDRIQ